MIRKVWFSSVRFPSLLPTVYCSIQHAILMCNTVSTIWLYSKWTKVSILLNILFILCKQSVHSNKYWIIIIFQSAVILIWLKATMNLLCNGIVNRYLVRTVTLHVTFYDKDYVYRFSLLRLYRLLAVMKSVFLYHCT